MKLCLSVLAGVALGVFLGVLVLREHLHPDFLVFWTAHQVPNPYDTQALREALGRVTELPAGQWPYPYPPTFLLLTAWFSLLPFSTAYLAFVGISSGAVAASVRHPASPLLLISPWVIYALMAGQTSLLVGALVLVAMVNPKAGWALGLAACIKPQFALFPALALLFMGRWQSLAWAAVTGATISLVTLANYGPAMWLDWLHSLPAIAAYSATITPHLDVPGWPLKAAVLSVGLWALWKRPDPVIATGLSLLVVPHSLWYNSAVMAPALAYQGWVTIGALFFFPSPILIALATFLRNAEGLGFARRPTEAGRGLLVGPRRSVIR